jgi:hypothetical protein
LVTRSPRPVARRFAVILLPNLPRRPRGVRATLRWARRNVLVAFNGILRQN